MKRDTGKTLLPASNAFRFVLVLGIANCFADMTYEGARSVTGPFLATLARRQRRGRRFYCRIGELIGYCLRSVTGVIGDRTGKYWLVTIVGCQFSASRINPRRTRSWPSVNGSAFPSRTTRSPRMRYSFPSTCVPAR
jgi:hypothetical protein